MLRSGGKWVAINGYRQDWLRAALEQFALRRIFGESVSAQRADYDLFLLTPSREGLETVAAAFDAGKLELPANFVAAEYPISPEERLEERTSKLHEAFERIKSRRVVGKLVFTF